MAAVSFGIGPACDGCGICVFACPKGAIRRSVADDAAIPYEVLHLGCNDCGKCAIVCPQRALEPDPQWATCRGRGCPVVTNRMDGWACTEGWARCDRCGSALWKAPGSSTWVCARCDLETKVICPKIRRHIVVNGTVVAAGATIPVAPGSDTAAAGAS